jgi:hypothetical protein
MASVVLSMIMSLDGFVNDQASRVGARSPDPAALQTTPILWENRLEQRSVNRTSGVTFLRSRILASVSEIRGETMSFQAYLDSIKAKTGKTVADFRVLADEMQLTRHGEIIRWLKETTTWDTVMPPQWQLHC